MQYQKKMEANLPQSSIKGSELNGIKFNLIQLAKKKKHTSLKQH